MRGIWAAGLLLVPPAYAGTAATPPPPTPAPTKVQAATLDCEASRDKLNADLSQLHTTEDEIKQLCALSASSPENNKYNTEHTKGACQSTYATINIFSSAITAKSDELCEIVGNSKATLTACTGSQASCYKAQAAYDRSAAAKLREIASLIKTAQKDLKARQADIRKVAEAYRLRLQALQSDISGASSLPQLQDKISGFNFKDTFGVPQGNQAIATNGWTIGSVDQAKNLFKQYNDAFGNAFPEDDAADKSDAPSTITGAGAQPSGQAPAQAPASGQLAEQPNDPLGNFTKEISDANLAAQKAFKFTTVTATRVEHYEEVFTANADKLGATGSVLGSVPGSDLASGVGSTLSGLPPAAAGVGTAASGASRLLQAVDSATGTDSATTDSLAAASAGLATASAKPGAESGAAAPAIPGNGTPSLASAATSGTAAADAPDPAPGATAKRAKDSAENDLLSSFAPIGHGAGGESPETSAPGTSPGARTAAARGPGAGSGTGAATPPLSSSTFIGAGPANGAGQAAGKEYLAPTGGGGLRGSPRTGSAHAPEPLEAMAKAQGISLRELLRRRLAERTKAGGDADASAAADAVLENLGGARSLASFGDVGGADDNERAGPQSIDSEPLFARVHDAHHRFALRLQPRQAGI